MILPNNGKIAIIDDRFKEVEELIAALAKEKMPYLFFTDQGGLDLPPDGEPIENIRLVFLDLDLGVGGLDPTEKIRIVQGRLVRILKQNTPYVLVIWSNHFDEYGETLIKDFEGIFSAYKPIVHCMLDKTVINNHDKDAIITTIRNNLKKELSNYTFLNAFLLWESSVAEAAGNITNNLVSVFDTKRDWDKNMNSLLFKLAQEQTGHDYIDKLNDTRRTISAFDLINSSLLDTIENRFNNQLSKIELGEVKHAGQGLSENEKIKLNTKLHLIKSDSLSDFFPGNIYLKDINGMGKEMVKRNFKESVYKEFKEDQVKIICLDITPSCDYSRGKNYSRILHGIKVDAKYSKRDLSGTEFQYDLCPIMEIESPSFVVFDYRCLRSFSKEEFELKFKTPPKFRIRKNLLLDIQAQMANHINRPGIVSIN